LFPSPKEVGNVYEIALQMSPQTLSWDVGVASAGYKMAAFPISCKLVACTRLQLPFFPAQLPRRCRSRGCSVTPINICCKQRRITCRRCYDKGLLICQINCTRSSGHIYTSRDILSLRYGRMFLFTEVYILQIDFKPSYCVFYRKEIVSFLLQKKISHGILEFRHEKNNT
jgi:hypothetical protein